MLQPGAWKKKPGRTFVEVVVKLHLYLAAEADDTVWFEGEEIQQWQPAKKSGQISKEVYSQPDTSFGTQASRQYMYWANTVHV